MKLFLLTLSLSFLWLVKPPGSAGQDILVIHGKDIWVRDAPTTGNVLMKLNEGDECKVLGMDRLEVVRGMVDFWYHIDFKGDKGWVFGSQTSRKREYERMEFSSLDEVVSQYTNRPENTHEPGYYGGSVETTRHIGTHLENDFAIVSFEQAGAVNTSWFSWLGFRENGRWTAIRFPGEAVELISTKGNPYIIMQMRETGGAFTFKDDILLFHAEPARKSFLEHQVIFEYAAGFGGRESVGGETTLRFPEGTHHRIEITETLDHSYDEMRKGTFTETYLLDEPSMKYIREKR